MRLRQLARKLAVKPAEIVEFLTLHHISIEVESNTRLDDSHVALILKQFAPSVADAVFAEIEAEEIQEAELSPEVITNGREPTGSPDFSISESQPPDEKQDVIRAPKIELSGLKVLGKIDLPEPKKKDAVVPMVESPTDVESQGKPEWRPEDRKFNPGKKGRKEQRSWNNPLAQEREREAREAEKKRKVEAERAKEQRTQNYFKKVKVSAPTKRAKLVEEQAVEMTQAELAEAPRTWAGRFFKWLGS